jgi:type IV secretory pathway VirB10-like protein
MGSGEAIADREAQLQEHSGGGRFNKVILWVAIAVLVIGSMAIVIGVHSSGTGPSSASEKAADEAGVAIRSKGEIDDLAAHGMHAHPAPTVNLFEPPKVVAQWQAPHQSAKTPSRYQQWAEEKYMKALESPEMVQAFHGSAALEIARARTHQGDAPAQFDPAVTVHPSVSAYTVMAGSVIPAVLISGVNSDLPGPILAQVSQNVFDSATGKYVLVPLGSRLIGAYQNASAYGQQRVQIAWHRLIFPNTSSIDLPQMPGTDQSGYAGFSDQVDNHYLATFGNAALMSLISAGQMVGQTSAFGGGGTYGPYGYYQPNQWAMAGEMAGSAASGQFGGLGQQMIGNGLNRPPTIQIRPGYEFNVMVTQDLVFGGPYGK